MNKSLSNGANLRRAGCKVDLGLSVRSRWITREQIQLFTFVLR